MKKIPFDWKECLRFQSLVLAELEFIRLTGRRFTKVAHCHRCDQPLAGVGGSVLVNGNNRVRITTAYKSDSRGNIGVELMDAKLCKRTFTTNCPHCEKKTKIFVGR